MTVDHRLFGDLAHVQPGTGTAVRSVCHHADGVHFPYQRSSVGGEPLVDLVQATAAGRVAVVVARQHRADTEIVEVAHPVQLPIERAGILQVEGHRHVPRTPCGCHVVDARSEPQTFIRGDPLSPTRDQAGDVLSAVGNIAHVHRNEAAARSAVAGQFADIRAPLQRQAAVLLPQQGRTARA
ncbi:hypothetical protein GCM10010317_017720 [Streptomyces mirabilis]|nr:hypothetical protein GCM10010317_017720 [Streptomyces mirabilis]